MYAQTLPRMKAYRRLLGRAYGRIVGFFLDRSVVHGIIDQRLLANTTLVDVGDAVSAMEVRLLDLSVDVSVLQAEVSALAKDMEVVPVLQADVSALAKDMEVVPVLQADVSALAKDMEVVPVLQADVSALAARTGEFATDLDRLRDASNAYSDPESGSDWTAVDRQNPDLTDLVALAARETYARPRSELLESIERRTLELLEGIGAPPHSLPETTSLIRTATVVGDLLMPAHDRFILPVLEATGQWEPEECDLVRDVLANCEGDLLIDIGAHVGYLTHVMAEASSLPILAVEAEPLNAALLGFNLIRNGHGNVLPIHAAAGSTTVLTDISVDPTNTGGHKAFFRPGLESSSIGRIALDDLLPPEVRVDFVKIDVEGMEQDVIRGMERIITDHRPTILAEFYPAAIEEASEEPAAVLNLFRAMGYRTLLPQHDDHSDAPVEDVVALARSAEGGYVTMLLVAK